MPPRSKPPPPPSVSEILELAAKPPPTLAHLERTRQRLRVIRRAAAIARRNPGWLSVADALALAKRRGR